MSATIIQELAAHPELIYRYTVDEYHDMIASGLISEGEPFELLDGQIVPKNSVQSRGRHCDHRS